MVTTYNNALFTNLNFKFKTFWLSTTGTESEIKIHSHRIFCDKKKNKKYDY